MYQKCHLKSCKALEVTEKIVAYPSIFDYNNNVANIIWLVPQWQLQPVEALNYGVGISLKLLSSLFLRFFICRKFPYISRLGVKQRKDCYGK